MIEGIEPFYQQIADSILESIKENWQTASIEAIFFADHIFYAGQFISADGKVKSFATNMNGERAFRRIRGLFKEAKKPLWGRASFEIHSNGKFDMKRGYDDCDENGFARFDEEAEAKRMREYRDRLA